MTADQQVDVAQAEMSGRLGRATRGVEDIRELDATASFGKLCRPEDIANAVVFAGSEEGRYITSQRIAVNGGGLPGQPG